MTKARIPNLALATLIFGGACGSDDGPEVDTSTTRKQRVASELCAREIACTPEESFEYELDYEGYSEEEWRELCEAEWLDEFEEHQSEECADARLDVYDCMNGLSCEARDALDPRAPADCKAEIDRAVESCGWEDDDPDAS